MPPCSPSWPSDSPPSASTASPGRCRASDLTARPAAPPRLDLRMPNTRWSRGTPVAPPHHVHSPQRSHRGFDRRLAQRLGWLNQRRRERRLTSEGCRGTRQPERTRSTIRVPRPVETTPTMGTVPRSLTEVSTDARPAARWLNQRCGMRRLSRDGRPRHEAARNARRNHPDHGHSPRSPHRGFDRRSPSGSLAQPALGRRAYARDAAPRSWDAPVEQRRTAEARGRPERPSKPPRPWAQSRHLTEVSTALAQRLAGSTSAA